MNTLTKNANYLASCVFGMVIMYIFTNQAFENEKWGLSIVLSLIYLTSLVRVGFLSDKVDALERTTIQLQALAVTHTEERELLGAKASEVAQAAAQRTSEDHTARAEA